MAPRRRRRGPRRRALLDRRTRIPGPVRIGSRRHLRRDRHHLARHATTAGCCRSPAPPRPAAPASAAESTHSRLDSEFASPFGDSESLLAADDGPGAGRFDHRARPRGLGRARAARRTRRQHASSPRPTVHGAGRARRRRVLRRGALEPRRAAVRHRGCPRRSHHPPGAGRRYRRFAAAALRRRHRRLGESRRSRRPGSSASTDGNFTKLRGARPAPASARRTPSSSRSPTTRRCSPSAAAASTPASNRRSLDGRGLIEATAFFNNYDDLDRRDADRSHGVEPVPDRQHLERARARASSSPAPRAHGWRLGGGSLQVRVGYTLLATEILAVDDSADGAAAVHRRRSPAAPARSPVLGGRAPRRRSALSAFLQGGGRGGVRDVDPSFGTFGGHVRRPGLQRLERGRGLDVLEPSAALRPRHQPLRSRLRGSARLPGARTQRDGGAEGCCEPLTSRSRITRSGRRSCRRRARSTSRPVASSASLARTARARRRCCACWPARSQPSRGRVYLDDLDLSRVSRTAMARRMAVVPQDTHLVFDFTALEVVLMGRYPHLATFEIEGPADIAIARERSRPPARARSRTGLFATLSGGEKQRVIIAGALAQIGRQASGRNRESDAVHDSLPDTGILLLDEPTAALDLGLPARSRDAAARPPAPLADRHRHLDPRPQLRRRPVPDAGAAEGWRGARRRADGRRPDAREHPGALRRRGRGPVACRRRPSRRRADTRVSSRSPRGDHPPPHCGRHRRLRVAGARRGDARAARRLDDRSACAARSTGPSRSPTTSTRRSSSSPGCRARWPARSSAPRSRRRVSSSRGSCAIRWRRRSRSASRPVRRSARCWRLRSTGRSAWPGSRRCPRAGFAGAAVRRHRSSIRSRARSTAASRPTSCCSPASRSMRSSRRSSSACSTSPTSPTPTARCAG